MILLSFSSYLLAYRHTSYCFWRFSSWHCVARCIAADVSEDRSVFTFRVKQYFDLSPEDEDNTNLRNVANYTLKDAASHPRRTAQTAKAARFKGPAVPAGLGWWKIQVLQKHVSYNRTHHLPLVTLCLGVQFIISLKQYLFAAPTRQNKTENNSINSHAHYATAFHPTVFLTGFHRFLVINI